MLQSCVDASSGKSCNYLLMLPRASCKQERQPQQQRALKVRSSSTCVGEQGRLATGAALRMTECASFCGWQRTQGRMQRASARAHPPRPASTPRCSAASRQAPARPRPAAPRTAAPPAAGTRPAPRPRWPPGTSGWQPRGPAWPGMPHRPGSPRTRAGLRGAAPGSAARAGAPGCAGLPGAACHQYLEHSVSA
jgi:hypothetical protein